MTSSAWDDICTTVDAFAKKVNGKVEQLTESAAVRLKISAKRAELEEEYGRLGRYVHEQTCLCVTEDAAEQRLALEQKIAESLETITALCEEIEALEAKSEK